MQLHHLMFMGASRVTDTHTADLLALTKLQTLFLGQGCYTPDGARRRSNNPYVIDEDEDEPGVDLLDLRQSQQLRRVCLCGI